MPFTTKRSPLELSAEQKQELEKLRRSRTEEKRGVQHAALLLDSAAGLSDGEVARRNEVNRHTVALCSQDSSVWAGSGVGRSSAPGQEPSHSRRWDRLGAELLVPKTERPGSLA